MSSATPPPSQAPRRRRPIRPRILVAALALLIPVVPIVVGVLLTGSGAPAAAETTASQFTPHDGSTQAAARTGTALPAGSGTIVAAVGHPTPMYRSPGGARFATLQTHTNFGSATFVPVVKVRGSWLGVIATQAGNNRLGWIRASDVSLSRNEWALHAILARHELVVTHDGRTVERYLIAVGKPTAPTPPGHYAVTDRLTTGDPSGPYGCCILALSAQAPHAISDWDGGNRIAIHSTPETDSIGHSVSHGCMRLSLADGRWLLAHIPLGTPAVISSA